MKIYKNIKNVFNNIRKVIFHYMYTPVYIDRYRIIHRVLILTIIYNSYRMY